MYQFDAQDDFSPAAVERFFSAFYSDEPTSLDSSSDPQPYLSFALRIINGLREDHHKIDLLIESCSNHWTIDRMLRVDRNILRVACYEFLFEPEIPHSVVINEAIEVAKRFGGEESPMFINGVLDEISRRLRPAPQAAGNQ